MECSNVQKRLSAYIEKVVSPKQKELIDAHLKGCKQCKRALADLKKAVDCVQKLEEVEPPAWLKQKVMARVKAEAEAKRGVLQKLFYPFHIKIPLEAVALILVAVGTIYIFKSIQPQIQLAQAPVETKEVAPPAFAPGRGAVHDRAEDKRTPAEPAEQFKDIDKEQAREKKSVGMAKAPVEVAKSEEAAPATGVAPTDELERKSSSSVAFEKRLRSEPRTEQVILTVNVADLENANRDIEGTIKQLGGRIIKQESIGDKAIINAEIDSKQMTEFFNQLNLIGEVQEESAALEAWKGDEVQEEGEALEAEEGDVGVQIDILKVPENK
jgi:hypothetical protein